MMADVRWVQAGAVETIPVEPHVVHFYADGSVRFEHRCSEIGGGRHKIVAPALMIGQGHTVLSRAPLHIEASILCDDCGLHGWVRDGRWVGC
jgi:hypothetical protein